MADNHTPWWAQDSELMDRIYDMPEQEEEYIASVFPHSQYDYALFSTGCKLMKANDHAVLPSDREIFNSWQVYTPYQRAELMTMARCYPDPRILSEHFELTPKEQEAVNSAGLAEGVLLKYYLAGRRIKSGEDGCPDSEEMLKQWQENFKHIITDSHHPEAEVLGAYIQHGKHHTRRKDRKASQLPLTKLHQDHTYFTTASKAATENDIRHVNEIMGKNHPHGWRWVHEKMLYNQSHEALKRGGHSERILHLFALVDNKGTIRKRMTVKIVGDDDKKKLKHTINSEVKPHKKVSKLACPNIIQFYGSSFRDREVTPHLGYIYMEYAPLGDLDNLVGRLRDGQIKQIPEPFIWIIFRALAEALHAMQTGRVMKSSTPPHQIGETKNKWSPVINPDIKLANIVLGAADDAYYPAYKTVKMIDFGQVFSDYSVVKGVVKNKYHCGTDSVCPPEQVFPALPGYERTPIGIHSEFYSVGLIMCSLTQGDDKERLTFLNPRFPHGYCACYSARLEGLITECLQDDPERRPTLPVLLAQIESGLRSWENMYGSANRPIDEVPQFMRFDAWTVEEHPIGSEAPEEWGGPREERIVGAHESSETLVSESTNSRKRRASRLEPVKRKRALRKVVV